VGKFLNGYEDVSNRAQEIPGLVENNIAVRGIYRPDGVVVRNNGDPTRLRGHQTPATTRSVIRSVRRAGDRPFFAWAGYVAPHAMSGGVKYAPVPPDGYPLRRAHRRPPSLSLPSFNAARPWANRKASVDTVRTVHRQRVRSLYAVDDGVRQIVRALKRRGVYRDTILVFASDNGMAMGSHGLMTKNVPYQDVVRVPLLMTGPGVPHREVDEVTTLVDLPGTLARLTGVRPMLSQDGGDLFSQPDDRAVLIQAGDFRAKWRWRGVYTRRYTYVDYGRGAVELFDRADDPHETSNLADEPGSTPTRNDLAGLLERLSGCAADACQATY
jgi:arylsulfatase A-like enzyme